MAAVAETPAKRVPVVAVVSGDAVESPRLHVAIAGVRVQLGVERRGQAQIDRAIAGRDVPVAGDGAAFPGGDADGTVAGSDGDALEAPGEIDRAIACVGVGQADGVGNANRAVTGVRLDTPVDVRHPDTAVTRIQDECAGEPFSRNRAISAARVQGDACGRRDDQADGIRRSGTRRMSRHSGREGRQPRRQSDSRSG